MATHKSAKKRIRSSETKRLTNRYQAKTTRTYIKRLRDTTDKKEAEAESGKYFWQRESHDRIVRDETHFRNAARYILKNPLKANLSESDFAYYVCGAKGFENRREEVLGT